MDIRLRVDTRGTLLKGKAPAVVQQNLDAAIAEVTMFLLGQVKMRTPQGVYGAQGGLLGSIQGEVLGKGTPLVKGIVASAHPYALVIEKGRKPGKGVPKGVLVPWIQKKLGITEPEELERVEFLIRQKIRHHGFAGAHMFEKAFTENEARITAIFQRAGFAITKELNSE